MRWLLLLVPALASADLRLDAHLGAGMEGGQISGEPRPDGVTEYGVGLMVFGQTHGVGLVVERVGRLSRDLPADSETKLDVLWVFRGGRGFVGGLGAGLREIEVAGEPDRRGSTLWGIDIFRGQGAFPLVRGRANLDLYFAWTFGLVRGEIYGVRHGDMAFPVRDYATYASSYIVGLGASFDAGP